MYTLFIEDRAQTADHQITLKEVATQAGIQSLDIFNQECSQKMLLNLSQHCVDWSLIGLYLDLTRADIAAVNGDYLTVDEKRAGMLERWKEKFAFKATYSVFIEALLACGRTEDAADACKTIAKGQCKYSSFWHHPKIMLHVGVVSFFALVPD